MFFFPLSSGSGFKCIMKLRKKRALATILRTKMIDIYFFGMFIPNSDYFDVQ